MDSPDPKQPLPLSLRLGMRDSASITTSKSLPAARRKQRGPSPNNPQASDSSHAAGTHRRSLLLLLSVVALVLVTWAGFSMWNGPPSETSVSAQWSIPSEYDAGRALKYLKQVVAFGPRQSGSPAMARQQAFLVDFFEKSGATVEVQPFEARHPLDGSRVEMKNIIARYRPGAAVRYLICAHYDTRPFPDQDPQDPQGTFVGANDGGSGTAAMMELSHHIDRLPKSVGVDLVLFDGEELVYDGDRDPYFLGSRYFAQEYLSKTQSNDPEFIPYQAGVLLDMIGDRELQLYYERNSWNYARDVTVEIWSTARRLRISAFKPRIRHLIRDDHLPLNEIAKIPTTDLIDFDYPRPGLRHQSYWHTTQDTVENCSGESIAAVVYVLVEWLSSKA